MQNQISKFKKIKDSVKDPELKTIIAKKIEALKGIKTILK
tara:strand:+ start:516 stop:635 length:120 start_codon:yes stop_codon:yes gene_type:complete